MPLADVVSRSSELSCDLPLSLSRFLWRSLRSGCLSRLFIFGGAVVICAATSAHAQVALAVGQNFTASTLGVDTGYTPPDCNGAPGPVHYVELINGRFSVYVKTNATKVQTMTTTAFWTAAGLTVPAGWAITDPRLVFDSSIQRWFASSVDFDPTSTVNTNRFLRAISAGADPTGTWRGTAFPSDPHGTNFADYPTLGLNSQGVFLAGNMFDAAGNDLGSELVSIPKSDLLLNPPVITRRTAFGLLGGSYGWVLQPVVNEDATSAQADILAVGDLGYDFTPHATLIGSALSGVTTSGSAGLSAPTTITVPPYVIPFDPPQPDGTTNLDDGDARISAKVYQFSGVLYAVHGIQNGARAAVRWYRIDASTFSLLESGTVSDPSLDLYYPSIAANASGTVVIAFNGSSISQHVSIYATVGQIAGNTTTFGNLVLLKAGVASYHEPGNPQVSRWGDYSTLTVDPVDPNRFWTIQMYPSSASAWSTQITELLTASPQLYITRSGSNLMVCYPGTTGVYNLQENPSLTNPTWTTLSNTTVSGGQACATVSPTGTAMFYRLQPR